MGGSTYLDFDLSTSCEHWLLKARTQTASHCLVQQNTISRVNNHIFTNCRFINHQNTSAQQSSSWSCSSPLSSWFEFFTGKHSAMLNRICLSHLFVSFFASFKVVQVGSASIMYKVFTMYSKVAKNCLKCLSQSKKVSLGYNVVSSLHPQGKAETSYIPDLINYQLAMVNDKTSSQTLNNHF